MLGKLPGICKRRRGRGQLRRASREHAGRDPRRPQAATAERRETADGPSSHRTMARAWRRAYC